MQATTSALLIASAEQIPVIDVDGTLFIQGGIFLLLLFILKPMLFDPWLKVYERRHQSIEGALKHADELRSQIDQLDSEYDERMTSVRHNAMELRSSARNRAQAESGEIVGAAQSDAQKQLGEARRKLETATSAARGALSGRVEALAREITGRVLGREA